MRFPIYIASPEESRTLDNLAAHEFSLPTLILMENAARSILECAASLWPDLLEGKSSVFILCGPGQNGGDGWVLARLFSSLGHKVSAYLVTSKGVMPQGDALINYNVAKNLNVPISIVDDDACPLPEWGKADLVVDAIFGSGLSKPLEGQPKRILASIEAAPRTFRVLAVDLPSGLMGSTGEALGPVVPADLTVSLGTLKLGLFLQRGPELSGAIRLGDIGLCPPMYKSAPPNGILLNRYAAQRLLPPRPITGHKGTFGHAVVAGGSHGKTGALTLAAMGALRSGAGLVTAAHPHVLAKIMEEKLTAPMTLSLPNSDDGFLDRRAAKPLLDFLANKSALGLGPGLGVNEDTKEFLLEILSDLPLPLVLDADGLSTLRYYHKNLLERKHPTIVTPHPGEAANLLGTSPDGIQKDRLAAAKQLASETGATVVLKGHNTIVMEHTGINYYICPSGGPILATGGTGDLLTGLITGFLARKMEPFAAAALGVYVHGRGGDLAAGEFGDTGVSPGELQLFFPRVFKELTLP
ncbi:MAG: NAD(P)H-hydrate dehydratase [Deltaproteobacteria bacterium]|jgi:NAD(P)H-hydrate epimerase|nr:NAD(P)H-hydrate dehydratase [Deltaproteobacteria bacterium]